jgi:hypothetical protein
MKKAKVFSDLPEGDWWRIREGDFEFMWDMKKGQVARQTRGKWLVSEGGYRLECSFFEAKKLEWP